jgi:hypothetical protein
VGSGFTKRVTKGSTIQDSQIAVFANLNQTFAMFTDIAIKTFPHFWLKRGFSNVVYEGISFS